MRNQLWPPPFFFSQLFPSKFYVYVGPIYFLFFLHFHVLQGQRAKNSWEAPVGLWVTVLLPVPGTVPKVDLPR